MTLYNVRYLSEPLILPIPPKGERKLQFPISKKGWGRVTKGFPSAKLINLSATTARHQSFVLKRKKSLQKVQTDDKWHPPLSAVYTIIKLGAQNELVILHAKVHESQP